MEFLLAIYAYCRLFGTENEVHSIYMSFKMLHQKSVILMSMGEKSFAVLFIKKFPT